jgi:predicted TPR repeat methyltransferase
MLMKSRRRAEFRDITKRLTGIDLSRRMAEYAARKSLYDCILVGDIADCRNWGSARYDPFRAGDV